MATVSQQLTPLDRELINRYQGSFPVTRQPFDQLAAELSVDRGTLLEHIDKLLNDGWLTHFGPLYNAERLGGSLTLAALEVDEREFSTVTEQINAMPAVAHNYRRDHKLNMWFVIATENPNAMSRTLKEIEEKTGLPVYNFPKLQEFYLGLWLDIGEQGTLQTKSIPSAVKNTLTSSSLLSLDETDRRIILATQEGLPLEARPYARVARQCSLTEPEVMERLQQMLGSGAIRRIGLVPNHYKLGFRGNGMTVWDIPDEQLNALGARVAELDFVSHCYERPRHAPLWSYNLFAMVHGKDRDAVRSKTDQISALLGENCRAHDVLFSTHVLKKTGLRLAA